MPINAGIMNALVRPVRSVQDYQDDYARQDMQQQGLQRNALMMQEAQAVQQDRERTRMEGETLRNALMSAGPNATLAQRAAAARGTGLQSGYKFADEWEKSDAEIGSKRATTAKDVAATGKSTFDLSTDKDSQARKLIQTAQDPQHAMELVVGAVRNGLWSEDDARQFISRMPQDAQQFAQWKPQQLAPALAADKLLPTIQTRNTGGSTDTLSVNPLTGMPTMTGSVRNTQSPDNVATVGASYANAAAVRAAAKLQADATRDSANTKRDQDTEMKLADDYRAQSKEFKDSKSAFEQLNSTLASATKSPAATLAAATKFMKILDPNSVVRESELGMALAASGVIDRATNYINILQNGRVLTPTQAADFKNISGKMFQAAQSVQKQIDADYTLKAKTYKLRPEMVTQDLGQNANATPAAGGFDMSAIDAEIARRRKGK